MQGSWAFVSLYARLESNKERRREFERLDGEHLLETGTESWTPALGTNPTPEI